MSWSGLLNSEAHSLKYFLTISCRLFFHLQRAARCTSSQHPLASDPSLSIWGRPSSASRAWDRILWGMRRTAQPWMYRSSSGHPPWRQRCWRHYSPRCFQNCCHHCCQHCCRCCCRHCYPCCCCHYWIHCWIHWRWPNRQPRGRGGQQRWEQEKMSWSWTQNTLFLISIYFAITTRGYSNFDDSHFIYGLNFCGSASSMYCHLENSPHDACLMEKFCELLRLYRRAVCLL